MISSRSAVPRRGSRHDPGGWVLTAPELDSQNKFATPDVVRPAPLAGARVEQVQVVALLPAKSVVVLEIGD